MCQYHRSELGTSATSRRWKGTPAHVITKVEFGPEEERAFQSFLERYLDELDRVETDIREFVEEASEEDLAELESIRAELSTRTGNYTDDFDVVFREGGEEAAEAGRALAARRHNLDVSFDVVPERTLEVLDDWAAVASESTLETITEDSTRWLRSAHEDGLSIDEIADELQNEFFPDRLEDHVAERAARTGTISSSNAGNHSAHVDAEGVVGEQWIATDDDRTRDSHSAVDGVVVAIDQSFSVGGESLEHPGDPTGSLEEIVNCRCTAVPVFADELSEEELEAINNGEQIVVNL